MYSNVYNDRHSDTYINRLAKCLYFVIVCVCVCVRVRACVHACMTRWNLSVAFNWIFSAFEDSDSLL